MRFRFNIGYVIGALLLMTWVCEAQSNITVTVPAGSTIMLPSVSHTNPIFLMPPPRLPPSGEVEQEMVFNLRQARFEAARLSALHSQRFEVLKAEVSASVKADRDERGVLTGTFSPETNWIATLYPVRGTNELAVRGANKDGTVELIFFFPVEAGSQIDINLRRIP